jgi:DNA-binding response OmpR family regulator
LGVRQIHGFILACFFVDAAIDLETHRSFFSNICVMNVGEHKNMSSAISGLSPQEHAVYSVLETHKGRVVSRYNLIREAQLTELSDRRCDALISAIRGHLGSNRIVTVRRRGWMLTD